MIALTYLNQKMKLLFDQSKRDWAHELLLRLSKIKKKWSKLKKCRKSSEKNASTKKRDLFLDEKKT